MATVTSKGDVALTNSIIDRNITEIEDELCGSVGKRAFRNCSVLEKADFSDVQRIKEEAFRGCSSLNALILRKNSVCTFENNALADTPIANGDGYIYVPAEKVDATKGNCTYPDKVRAIEDYPEVCAPYSWVAVFKSIDNGSYKDAYKIGDTVPLDLGTEGVVNMRIVAFDADTLADGTGTAAITWAAYDRLSTAVQFHNEDVHANWSGSFLRKYLNETVKPLLPNNVRSEICAVTKKHFAYTTARTTETTDDELWVPSISEIMPSAQTLSYYEPERVLYYPNVEWSSYANGRLVRSVGELKKCNYFAGNTSAPSSTAYSQARSFVLCFCTGKSK